MKKRKSNSRKKEIESYRSLGRLFILLFKTIWFIIKIPYYIIKGIYMLFRKTNKGITKGKIEMKRRLIKSVYSEIKVIKEEEGNYREWEKSIYHAESKIGIVIGARGSGKTAFGVKFMENLHSMQNKRCYAIGFNKEDFPKWIKVVENINEIANNSFVLIDEGGILFSSRKSMSEANKFLSDLILIARHKNLSILFISQNSSNLDVNILRQADYLVLKPSSLLQKEFERKIIQKIYDKIAPEFESLKEINGICYIYADKFKGFVSNDLPSFWNVNISKSFR